METQMIQGSPCPLCGEIAFSLESLSPTLEFAEYAFLWRNDVTPPDSHLQPCECTGCGNVHMLVTRT